MTFTAVTGVNTVQPVLSGPMWRPAKPNTGKSGYHKLAKQDVPY